MRILEESRVKSIKTGRKVGSDSIESTKSNRNMKLRKIEYYFIFVITDHLEECSFKATAFEQALGCTNHTIPYPTEASRGNLLAYENQREG
ncbi:hypothetical protein AV530_019622 [Patagioenas fasciata monilis]|uniref:Uncharacterized protein n=1 Tax=Patagioenas fasciata monilis TaxID=372326 RepID=A0A1V4JE06_PATFA|nr:hypothetical protein AV530_019622 [Patagioenas fasciata monilis]